LRVLVTGATGMVGSFLLLRLLELNVCVRAVMRQQFFDFPLGIESVIIADISQETDWTLALAGIDVVIHAAAQVHVLDDSKKEQLSQFRSVNASGTLNLARQAACASVGRFIFISSIKVNGEETAPGCPFTEEDEPAPQGAYAISKYEAENGLRNLAEETDMDVVILRSPLVYGCGVKANFQKLLEVVDKKIPLPLGGIQNRRSLVAVDNLVDLITTCLVHSAASNQTFFVSDGDDLSTTDLLKRIGLAFGKPAFLLPVPQVLVELGLKMLGRGDVAMRLCSSLQVDIRKAEQLLSWLPPISVGDALLKTTKAYLEKVSK